MAQEAELKISSTSIERTTVAVDALYESLVKLGKGADGVEGANGKLTGSEQRKQTALKNSNIASEKAIALLQLEQKNLDKTSQEYAELRGAILAKEVAAKKGIDTTSKEYKSLKSSIVAKEKATIETRRLALEQKKLSVSTGKTSHQFKGFTNSLDRATKHVQLIDGPLGGVASRMTALSGIIKGGALGYAALALGTGLATKALWDGANVADRNIVSMKGLEAQLIATNHASGFTAESLDVFSRSLAFATLDNTAGVKELVGTMLSFDKVSGDAFTKAITLSQSLGIAMKQSPVTAAKTLGKVLQNPIENYKQLKRSGIEFSKVEKDNLKLAQRNNDLREQQKIILDKVESKFKDVATAQANSLSGDKDTLGQNWEELWEFLGSKLIPTFRLLTQTANAAVETTRELFETDAETQFRKWAVSTNMLTQDTDKLGAGLEKLKEELSVANKEAEVSVGIFDQLTKSITAGYAVTTTWVTAEESAVQVIKDKIKFTEDLIVAREKGDSKDNSGINDRSESALEANKTLLDQQQRLTKAFIETGDTKSLAYRKIKAAIDAENVALKTNFNTQSDEYKILQQNLLVLSELTNQRVKHNISLQKEKALQSKQRGLEREVELNSLLKEGIAKNSSQYLKHAAILDAKNAAIQAGLVLGGEEHKRIEAETLALAKLQEKANSIKDFDTAGFKWSDAGRILVEGTDSALKYAETEMKNTLIDLLVGGDIDQSAYDERLKVLTDSINERVKQDLLPLGFTIDQDGNAIALESVEALMVERNQLYDDLNTAWNEGKITDEIAYQERFAAIQEEYETAAGERRVEIWRKTAEAKKLIQAEEVAGEISQGLQMLSVASGNNKKLAKVAKAMALFQASASLVQNIAEAAKIGFPQNIPMIAGAFAQGANMVNMAKGLNEPNFANGGVDIKGKGTGRSDDIKANIANGESVITASATNRHKDTLRRMNAGLPIGGSSGTPMTLSNSIVIQGDASEQTVGLIDDKLRSFEQRVEQIANGAALQTIQEEQGVGGLFDPI